MFVCSIRGKKKNRRFGRDGYSIELIGGPHPRLISKVVKIGWDWTIQPVESETGHNTLKCQSIPEQVKISRESVKPA